MNINPKMIIFGGSSSIDLAKKVAQNAELSQNAELDGVYVGEIDVSRFPDGEFYIRILSDVKGEDCVFVQSTQNHDALIELFLCLDTLKDLGAKKIYAVIPYLGYARQDKRFKDGEALSAKTILEIIDRFSDRIITINSHFLKSEGEFEFHGVRVRNLDAFPLVADYFKGRLDSPVVIAPDKGSIEYAKRTSEIIGCEFDHLIKTRISSDKVEVKANDLDVSDRNILILDDMISTGGTIIQAAKFVRSIGAKTVNVGCVHGVFSRGTPRFRGIVDELVCTDTIPTEFGRVSVADLICDDILQFDVDGLEGDAGKKIKQG